MRAFARILAVALVAVAAACGGSDGINEPGQGVAGTYALQTVNGAALPFVFFEGDGFKLEVTAATYVLEASGSFTNSASFRETRNGVVTTSSEVGTGKYAVRGTTVTFTDTDGDVQVGEISGNKLQFTGDGITAVFVR